jgi:nucleotide-binding universal stress UspA family protein
MFEKILLAVALQNDAEYSRYVLALKPVGITLAKGSKRKIFILTVFNYEALLSGGQINILPPDILEKEKEGIRQNVENKLEEYARDFLEEGIEVEKIIREGNPRDEIINAAKEIKADLILIGAHSRRSIFDVLLGKTAESITKNAPCTVIKVSPEPW